MVQTYNLVQKNIKNSFSMGRTAVLLGDCRNAVIVNMVIIIAKNEIHKCKNNHRNPTLVSILH